MSSGDSPGIFFVDLLDVVVVFSLVGVRCSKVSRDHLALHEFRFDQDTQLRIVSAAVPEVGDVAAIHDFSEELAQVVPRNQVIAV